ncbi:MULTISPECIES: glycosyltransferase family 4 protein [Arenibacter]|uniref:glycosyltransferase family 4 protein n=1 Tax=Arenibacter TaxID=178469 RepID=UPI0004DED8AE|nr:MULTISPECIES: glycosyltransferase family 4 protein [Arenibacter]GBF18521.1 putative teichuronic acid biosynthesis glycosyltransferase TuaH [Arenibacter sp. NBRC 103722]
MKLLFLTDNFPPEFNAPATRTHEHCKEWVKNGVDVTVITCVPNFPEGKVYKGYKNKFYQKEIIDGIKVIRVWTYITANEGFFKRTIDYISFMISSFLIGLFIKCDVIIATSPQFFTAISGRWLSFWKRAKWVMEIRDIWPESIKAVGAMKNNPVISFFEYLEHKMYLNAWKIITVTDSFKKQLIDKHKIKEDKIEVVKNGANMELYGPKPKNQRLLEEHGLKGKFIIGYIGTHGMAHKLDFILDCAKDIKDSKIHFLFLGTGAEKENLLAQKRKFGIHNVTMLDPVEKKLVSEYISILDVGLVNLRKSDTFKSVIPSKIFELTAMHKPILLGVEGEAKNLIQQYNVGLAFIPENKVDFLEKMQLLKNQITIDPNIFKLMLIDFDRTHLALKMLRFIDK